MHSWHRTRGRRVDGGVGHIGAEEADAATADQFLSRLSQALGVQMPVETRAELAGLLRQL